MQFKHKYKLDNQDFLDEKSRGLLYTNLYNDIKTKHDIGT